MSTKFKLKFPIYDLSHELFSDVSSGAVEHGGTKEKGWFTSNLTSGEDLRILFKEGRRGSGENWAEKVTCELAEQLNLPHATYDLAYLANNKPCVISPSFLGVGEELILGNQLIEGFDANLKRNNTKHTLDGMLQALQKNFVQLPFCVKEQPPVIRDVSALFIGYLCFDAWISNTDRHAENWGVIYNLENTNVLAPTFDHASSLGRNEPDEKRIKRMQSKDKGYNVHGYVKGAMTPTYDVNGNMLNTISLVQECRRLLPQATDYWIEKIVGLMNNENNIMQILDAIPDEFISGPARDFAMAMLIESKNQLRELQNG